MNSCYLHVGLHKTGTTTFQHFLKNQRITFNHVGLWCWDADSGKVINTETPINANGESDFYSWEQLSFMDEDEATKLISRLRKIYSIIIVIICFRRIDSLYTSHKNQSVKHISASRPPGAVFERKLYGHTYNIVTAPNNNWYLNKYSHLQKWSSSDEIREVQFENIAGNDLPINFIREAGLCEIIAATDPPPVENKIRNKSMHNAQFLIANHIFASHHKDILKEFEVNALLKTLLRGNIKATKPVQCSDLDEDFHINESSLSLLDYCLDLLRKINELKGENVKLNARIEGLKSGKSIITKPEDFIIRIKSHLKSNKYVEAYEAVKAGLEKIPNEFNLLIIATDVYRASGDREKSLEYSELLITHHPGNWNGYGRAAQDLVALKRLEQAQEKIQAGLEKVPNQVNLLTIATDVYRASGDRDKSLEYSELLITHHPGNWNGYGRAAQDKLSLGRFEPGEHQKQMERCQPPKSKNQLIFWNQICNYKKTMMENIWSNSYRSPPQATDFESATILDSWQPFQYWSQGSPPSQIKEITEYWNTIFRSIGVKPVKMFDKTSALDYIKNNHPEISRSFETSFHYAVEADVFRVAYAQKNDCIWLDADLYPNRETVKYLKTLLLSRKTTLFCRWMKPWITNAFFIAPSSSLFFANILTSTANIDFSTLPHTKETVFKTFGPGRYNQEIINILSTIHQNNEAPSITECGELEHFNFVNDHNFASMGPPFKLKYKSTNDAWQNSLIS